MRLAGLAVFIVCLFHAFDANAQGAFDLHLDSTKLLTPKPVPPPSNIKQKEVRKPDSIVSWTSTVNFSWDDFWGKPDPKSIDPAKGFSGVFYIDKPDPYTGQPITVRCEFNKYKSWKNPKKKLDVNLLIHEKVHFNISELHARMIRSECSKIDRYSPTAKSEMIAIFNRISGGLKKFQDEYDEATDHSKKQDKQAEWNMKVSSMMRDLAIFASR